MGLEVTVSKMHCFCGGKWLMMLEREMMMSPLVLVGAEKKKQEKKFRILKDKRKAKIQRAHSRSLLMQTSVNSADLSC